MLMNRIISSSSTALIAGIMVFLALSLSAQADETLTVEYTMGNIGESHRFWHGQGELMATDLSEEFALDPGNNDIISYATDASTEDFNNGFISFRSEHDDNYLHALFLAPRPQGHGIYRANLSMPHTTGANGMQKITIRLENIARILYLNGPMFFEDESIHSDGDYKVVSLESPPEESLDIIYATTLSYGIILNLLGFMIFSLILSTWIIVKRKSIAERVRDKVQNYNTIKDISVFFNEIDNVLEIHLPRFSASISKYIGRNEKGVYINIPRSVIAGTFALMLAYMAISLSLLTISNYIKDGGLISYAILGFIILLGAMIFLSLLAVKTTADFMNLMSLLAGGTVLVVLSRLELLAIPVAIAATLLVYVLGRISSTVIEKEVGR